MINAAPVADLFQKITSKDKSEGTEGTMVTWIHFARSSRIWKLLFLHSWWHVYCSETQIFHIAFSSCYNQHDVMKAGWLVYLIKRGLTRVSCVVPDHQPALETHSYVDSSVWIDWRFYDVHVPQEAIALWALIQGLQVNMWNLVRRKQRVEVALLSSCCMLTLSFYIYTKAWFCMVWSDVALLWFCWRLYKDYNKHMLGFCAPLIKYWDIASSGFDFLTLFHMRKIELDSSDQLDYLIGSHAVTGPKQAPHAITDLFCCCCFAADMCCTLLQSAVAHLLICGPWSVCAGLARSLFAWTGANSTSHKK